MCSQDPFQGLFQTPYKGHLVKGLWDLGRGTWDLGPAIRDLGPGSWNWDLGLGTWDLWCGIWDLRPGTLDLGPGPRTWDLGPGTWVVGPGMTWDLGRWLESLAGVLLGWLVAVWSLFHVGWSRKV